MNRVILCFLLLLLPTIVGAADLSSIEFDSVRIEGNISIDSAAIESQLSSTSGKLSAAELSEQIQKIFATGYFQHVSASLRNEGPGARVLIYQVKENPSVRRVFITGNVEVSDSELAPILRFEDRRFFNILKATRLAQQAESLYQAKGFYDASIGVSTTEMPDNQVEVTFKVDEGKRYRIRRVFITGLETLREADILSAIQTSRYKWWNSWLFGTGRLSMQMVSNDRNIIRQFLLDNGLVDGRVSEALIESRDGQLFVTFDVSEGEVYSVGRVSVAGDLFENSQEATLKGIKTNKGDTFNASAIREDAFQISDKFSDIGYAYVNVTPQTRIDSRLRLVDIEFLVEKGKLVTVNRIEVRGNDKTYDHVIRRELTIAEQETYSGPRLRRSQQLLERLGYFEEVNITTEPAERDDEIDLLVNVREGATGSFSVGAGYSSSDGPIANMRLSEANIFGTGRRVELDIEVGTERDSQILSINDPRFRDSQLSLGADLQRTLREYRDFDRQLAGGSITSGYPLEPLLGEWAQDISFSLRYELLGIKIRNVNEDRAAQLVIDSQGSSSVSGITPRLTRNTINNPLNPTSGSRQSIGFEITGLGGSEKYYLIDGRNQLYVPLIDTGWGPIVGSWRIRAAWGETFDGDPFPLFRRFFPGGINSIRGYRNRSLGPRDERGREYGGSKELVNNLELIFPLVRGAGFNAVIFYDLGEAYDDDQRMDLSDLRQSWGYGIRWISPLGPIRLEFGYPIDRREGESAMTTMFSFGAPL
jgi:outer membrane protein insertion porin family